MVDEDSHSTDLSAWYLGKVRFLLGRGGGGGPGPRRGGGVLSNFFTNLGGSKLFY